jgi:serine/threonine protein phosphatase PrpC
VWPPPAQDEQARVEAAGGRVRNDRINGVLAVSRSFGDVEHKGLATPTAATGAGATTGSAEWSPKAPSQVGLSFPSIRSNT